MTRDRARERMLAHASCSRSGRHEHLINGRVGATLSLRAPRSPPTLSVGAPRLRRVSPVAGEEHASPLLPSNLASRCPPLVLLLGGGRGVRGGRRQGQSSPAQRHLEVRLVRVCLDGWAAWADHLVLMIRSMEAETFVVIFLYIR